MPAQIESLPVVFRIVGDTIVELVYDEDRRQTGLLISKGPGDFKIEQETEIAGERLIPYSAKNNLIAHRCVLLPSRPEPFGTKKDLLADIEDFLHRYVDLSPTFERIASHYVLLTWLYDAFAEVPYLRLRGEYGTGKTRGLIAIGSLCYRPFFAAGASTVSPIFHTLDRFGGTLVLDEADLRFSDATADLVKLFNNGTVRGLPVLRTVQNRHKEFNPAAFTVFGPKIIAMRGSFNDEALESRFLTEETGSRPLRHDVPLHLPDALHQEALAIRNRLLSFRLAVRRTVRPTPEFAIPGLDPRLNQIALPLLSLVDDPVIRAEIAERLTRQQVQIREHRQRTMEARVLKATLGAFGRTATTDISIQQVADEYQTLFGEAGGHEPISPRRIGSVLRSKLHVQTRKKHGVYVISPVDKPKLDALALRYGFE